MPRHCVICYDFILRFSSASLWLVCQANCSCLSLPIIARQFSVHKLTLLAKQWHVLLCLVFRHLHARCASAQRLCCT